MGICIIVDGYNAGKQFPKSLANRGYDKCFHVQSTREPLLSLSQFEPADYKSTFVYQGNVDQLIKQIGEMAHGEKILCVIAGSEPGIELTDAISERLKLDSTNGTELSKARRNKYEMRLAMQKAGLKAPDFIQSNNLDEIKIWIEDTCHYPVVIKPLDSAGTDGVSICSTFEELETAFQKIINQVNILGTMNNNVLVESFLKGEEYVVNSVSCQGKHIVNDLWAYRKKLVNGRLIYGREELLEFDGQLQNQLVEYTHSVLNALNIKFGPTHAEVIMTESGPVLVEVAARISGATNIQMSQECVGHDAINLTIDSYLRPKVFFEYAQLPNKCLKRAMVVDLAVEQEGYIEKELLSEKLKNLPTCVSMVIKAKPGSYLRKTQDLMSSPAKFHLVHEKLELIYEDYNKILEAGKTGFVLTNAPLGALSEIAERWKKEYQEQQGIPSSYRTEPSSVVSTFFFPYYTKRNSLDRLGKVVDMGCGRGRNSIFFSEKGSQVTSIDIVAENIEQLQKYAEEHHLKISAVCGDITNRIPAEDKSIDIVIDIFCYKHQLDESRKSYYRKELARIMKDDGYYLLSLAGKDDGYYGPLLKKGSSNIVDPETNVASVLFDPEDIRKEFSGYKLKRLQTLRKAGLMHGKMYERVTHAFIMKKDLIENYSNSDEEWDDESTRQNSATEQARRSNDVNNINNAANFQGNAQDTQATGNKLKI